MDSTFIYLNVENVIMKMFLASVNYITDTRIIYGIVHLPSRNIGIGQSTIKVHTQPIKTRLQRQKQLEFINQFKTLKLFASIMKKMTTIPLFIGY